MESQQNTGSGTRTESAETGAGQVGEEERVDLATAEPRSRWKLSTSDEIIFYALIILSLIGAAVSHISVNLGHVYWLAMIPIIGVATIYVERVKVREGEVKWPALIRTQLFHWGSLLLAVELVSLLAHFGRINNTAVSSVNFLLLAQATFLVGVHRDWRFCVVGVFQALCLIALTYVETYLWLMLVVAIAIIALGIYFHRKFPTHGY